MARGNKKKEVIDLLDTLEEQDELNMESEKSLSSVNIAPAKRRSSPIPGTKGLYGGVEYGKSLSDAEAGKLGLPAIVSQKDILEQNYAASSKGDPDKAAKLMAVAEQTGLPVSMLDKPGVVQQEANARIRESNNSDIDWDRATAFYPGTSGFLANADVMAVAHDDIPNLLAVEMEAKRVAGVKAALGSVSSRGGRRRGESLRALRTIRAAQDTAEPKDASPSDIARKVEGYNLFGATESQGINPLAEANQFLGDAARSTAVGKGITYGQEMTSIAEDAIALYAAETAGSAPDESKWEELEKRLAMLDRDRPEGKFRGLLYETGKFYGQQLAGAWTTGGMAATGAVLTTIVGGGLAVTAAPALLPAVAVGTGISVATGWTLGTRAGVFVQSAKVEGGLDIIQRRKMSDAEGNTLSHLATGLGSAAVGVVNGFAETVQWGISLSPLARTKALQRIIPAVAARVAVLPSFTHTIGRWGRDWLGNLVGEAFTEVVQDAVPIAIDEAMKYGLLGNYDRRSIYDISNQLSGTATHSLYSFSLISGIGPTGAAIRGDYRMELARREIEASQTRMLDRKLDGFAAKLEATKLLKRVPGMGADLAQTLLGNAGLDNVYIPAQSVRQLFQDGKINLDGQSEGEWVSDNLGISEEEFQASLDNGPELEVEAMTFLQKLDGDVRDHLRPDIRFDPLGLSVREAVEAENKLEDLRKEDFYMVQVEIERERKDAESALNVYRTKRMELIATGREEALADDEAKIYAAMSITSARQWNQIRTQEKEVSPGDWAKRFPLVFRNSDTGSLSGQSAGLNLLEQSVYHEAPNKIQDTIDSRYFAAIEADDMGTAQRIVDDQMRRNGYISNTDYRLNHRAPSHHDEDTSVRLDNALKSDIVPGDFWTAPHHYMLGNDVSVFRRVLSTLKSKEQVITMYRAIPKGVKESHFRNGDWITPSLDYARGEGELIGGGYRIIEQTVSLKDVWWDANSINEFGYDDGNAYTYKDTKNNRKLTDTIVRDESGNIVPPSKRFNQRKPETYYQTSNQGESTDSTPSWREKLTEDANAWRETLNKHFTDQGKLEIQLKVMRAPMVLRMLGMEEADLRISSPKIDALLEKHALEIDINTLKGLPEKLAEPVMVFRSSKESTNPNAVVVVLNLQGINGASVIVPVSLTLKKTRSLGKYYSISSIYTKKTNNWYTDQTQDGLLIYADTEQLAEWESNNDIQISEYIKKDRTGVTRVQFPGSGRTHGLSNIIETQESAVKHEEGAEHIKKDRTGITGVQFPGSGRTRGLSNIIKTQEDVVKLREGFDNQHYQNSARGSIEFPLSGGDGKPTTITFTPQSDASTFIHELKHFKLEEMKRLKAADTRGILKQNTMDLDATFNWWSENASDIARQISAKKNVPAEVRRNITAEKVREWISSDMPVTNDMDRAIYVATHEYDARGWEAYLREGKAPSIGMQGVFRRFKEWLMDIYRSITDLDVKLSPEIREVFDRILATEEAIEDFRTMLIADEALGSDTIDIGALGEMFSDEPFEAAKERLLSTLLTETTPEKREQREKRANEIRPTTREEVLSEKPWQVMQAIEQDPDLKIDQYAIIDSFGESVLANLPQGLDAENGIDLDSAAKLFDYKSPEEMIRSLEGRRQIDDEVEVRVEAYLEKEFSSLINDPEAMNLAAEMAYYEGDERSEQLAAESIGGSQYAALMGEHEEALSAAESPRSRPKIMAWLRAHGKISYKSVVTEFSKERAAELIRKTGPGIFSKDGQGLDELAQEMNGNGIPLNGDEDLFNILLGENPQESPLDAEYRRGKEEGIAEAKDRADAKRQKQRIAVERIQEFSKKHKAKIKEKSSNFRTAAENIVAPMTIEALGDKRRWIKFEREARRKWERALKKGDEATAVEWKNREQLNHAVVKQMYKQEKESSKIRNYLSRFANRGAKQTFGMDPQYLHQTDAIMSRFDVSKYRRKEDRAAVSEAVPLSEFISQQALEEGEAILIPDWVLNENDRRHYSQLNVWEFKSLQESVKNLVYVGRNSKKMLSLEKAKLISELNNEIMATMLGYYKDATGRMILNPKEAEDKKNIVVASKMFLAELSTAEQICRAIDGYMDLGPMQRHFFQPIRDAITRETLSLNAVFKEARDLRERAYGKNPKFDNWTKTFENIPLYEAKEVEPGKWQPRPTDKPLILTREQAICAVLNMGNEANTQRLAAGWGWTASDMAEIVASLSEQDFQYVQGVWDLVNSLWPQVSKVHELMTGMTLQKVESVPLKTPYGEIQGGYYPIVTDLRYSSMAAAQTEREDVLRGATMGFAATYTKMNHRKARAENVQGRPPLLSLGVLDNHLANVIHDYECAPAIRDARKILNLVPLRAAVTEVMGEDKLKVLNNWLNAVAGNTKNNGVTLTQRDRILQKAQSGVAMFALGANVGGALMQTLGYFPLAHRIGAVATGRAIINGLVGNTDIYKFCLENSDFMREQVNGNDREVRKLRENWSSQSNGISGFQEMLLNIYPLCQNLCNVPGWVESYKIGVKKYNGNHMDAVHYADSIIRQTQSASSIADIATFEHGPLGRLLTMFYSWFRVMYQMQTEAIKKVVHGEGFRGRFGDLASYTFYVLIGQSVAEALIRGNLPVPEDDESMTEAWARWIMARLMLAPLAPIPIVRDVANVLEGGQYRFTPIEGAFSSVSKLLQVGMKNYNRYQKGDDVDVPAIGLAAAETVGYGTGIPNRAMIKAANAFWKYYSEDESIPWGHILLGRRKPKN